MPRLTEALHHRIHFDPMKKFTNYRSLYPYKQVLPAILGNGVSGRRDNKKTHACLQEMSLMLVCLKKHDFEQSRCEKEMETFNECLKQHEKIRANSEDNSSTGGINAILSRYPQPHQKD